MAKGKGGLPDKLGTLYVVIIRAVPSIIIHFLIQVYFSKWLNLPMLFYLDRPVSWILPVISMTETEQAAVARLRAATGLVGGCFAVVTPEGTRTECFGWADRESGRPVTERSFFDIASNSKAFTAMGGGDVAEGAAALEIAAVGEALHRGAGALAQQAQHGGGRAVGGVALRGVDLDDDALVHVEALVGDDGAENARPVEQRGGGAHFGGEVIDLIPVPGGDDLGGAAVPEIDAVEIALVQQPELQEGAQLQKLLPQRELVEQVALQLVAVGAGAHALPAQGRELLQAAALGAGERRVGQQRVPQREAEDHHGQHQRRGAAFGFTHVRRSERPQDRPRLQMSGAEGLAARQRAYFLTGATLPFEKRRGDLERLGDAVRTHDGQHQPVEGLDVEHRRLDVVGGRPEVDGQLVEPRLVAELAVGRLRGDRAEGDGPGGDGGRLIAPGVALGREGGGDHRAVGLVEVEGVAAAAAHQQREGLRARGDRQRRRRHEIGGAARAGGRDMGRATCLPPCCWPA